MSRARECGEKERHATRLATEDAKYSIVRKRGARAGTYQVYKCKWCGTWHVGHKKKRRR